MHFSTRNFFSFLGLFIDKKDFDGINKIYYEQEFKFDPYNIRFKCYNTAWMSQKKEKQGDIFFPLNIIEENTAK